jgi:phosphatidylinositol alpha-mannosyltransferase
MKPLKIGFVFDDSLDKPDGVQQYILALGSWFAAQGHEVHYLVGETKRTDIANLHSLSHNMNVKFNGNRMSMPLPANKQRIRELLNQEKFDVLHVQMPYSPFLGARIIKAAPKTTAIIGTFHIMPQTGLVRLATYMLGAWLRTTLRRFDKVFAVSMAAQGFASKVFKLPDVSVLPNVVDVRRFADVKSFEKYTDNTPTIMFLGRLVERKGCNILLEAVTILKSQTDISFRVVVCGKGELLPELKEYVAKHELEKYVEFTGFVEEADKPRYLKSADITVFPSNGGESFGIVLIEAMAATRPVVLAGDNDGYRSVMSERPELLFESRNSKALADLLAKYLQDKQAAQAAAAWQTQHVRQFDTATVGMQLIDTYIAFRSRS